MSKAFNLNPRKPNVMNEEAARKLEAAIAAKGEGVAGQADAPLAQQVHELTRARDELTSSGEALGHAEPAGVQSPPSPPEKLDGEAVAAVAGEGASARAGARGVVSSRARGTAKSRAREVPATGVGTMHNPRVRKTDGVQTRSTTVHLPVELAKKLAVHCAMTGRKHSDVIAEAVESLLG
jgi:hypothetical protein